MLSLKFLASQTAACSGRSVYAPPRPVCSSGTCIGDGCSAFILFHLPTKPRCSLAETWWLLLWVHAHWQHCLSVSCFGTYRRCLLREGKLWDDLLCAVQGQKNCGTVKSVGSSGQRYCQVEGKTRVLHSSIRWPRALAQGRCSRDHLSQDMVPHEC